MATGAHARIGTRLAGRYELLAILGEGGMGAVYRARHAFTGAAVAVKVMHASVATSARARERFLREAQAPAAIGHPGIVRVHDAGVAEDGALYLALDLLEGEDLGAAVANGTVDGPKLVEVTVALLDCLGAAHASGLLHRDIKPDNVFLAHGADGATTVRLLDFGITRQLGDSQDKLTQTGAVIGTPHFMSPEQARGGALDASSDLYAVGGTMFFAVTGRPPFVAANYNLLISAMLTEPAIPVRTLRPEVPADLAAVIDRALSRSPSDRFTNAEEMRSAIEACEMPTGLTPIPAIERPAPPAATVASKKSASKGSSEDAEGPSLGASGARATSPFTLDANPSGAAVPAGQASADPPAAAPSRRTPLLWLAALSMLVAGAGAAWWIGSDGGEEATRPPEVPEALLEDLAERARQTSGSAQVAPSMEEPAPNATADAATNSGGNTAPSAQESAQQAAAQRAEKQRQAQRRQAAAKRRQAAAEEAERRHFLCRMRCDSTLRECRQQNGGRGLEGAQCRNGHNRCMERCPPG